MGSGGKQVAGGKGSGESKVNHCQERWNKEAPG